ncbi:hypothetical protein [Streptomyces goshikiensis]|uniref:hypothetical protein n=1 Tax=Streptomyces goshikiensis TaxID=1942 RepID=UPI0033A36C11
MLAERANAKVTWLVTEYFDQLTQDTAAAVVRAEKELERARAAAAEAARQQTDFGQRAEFPDSQAVANALCHWAFGLMEEPLKQAEFADDAADRAAYLFSWLGERGLEIPVRYRASWARWRQHAAVLPVRAAGILRSTAELTDADVDALMSWVAPHTQDYTEGQLGTLRAAEKEVRTALARRKPSDSDDLAEGLARDFDLLWRVARGYGGDGDPTPGVNWLSPRTFARAQADLAATTGQAPAGDA